MAIIRAQVTLPHDNGLPEDAAVNTWHFATAGTSDATLTAIATAVDNVYTDQSSDAGGLLPALGSFINATRANPSTIKLYDAESAPPNPPLKTVNMTLTGAVGSVSKLPSEVALCGSFQAAPVSGEDQARKRGRVFFGPLTVDALISAAPDGVPSDGIKYSIIAAFTRLKAASDAAADWSWIVWSRGARERVLQPDGVTYRATGPLLPPQNYPVASFWVDDRFDTQRRRGTKPTAKFSVVPGLIP